MSDNIEVLTEAIKELLTMQHEILSLLHEIREGQRQEKIRPKSQAAPAPVPSDLPPGCPPRSDYKGLTDGEYGLFPVYVRYRDCSNAEADKFPGLVSHLTAWEHGFMEDWLTKGPVDWKLSNKQQDIFERIGEKLSYNIHYNPYVSDKNEEDYFDDDIPF